MRLSQSRKLSSFDGSIWFACDWEGNLCGVFGELMEGPTSEGVEFEGADAVGLEDVGEDGYGRWVAKLYGNEMRERFGRLNVFDKGLLRTGMVTLFRSGRVKWQG